MSFIAIMDATPDGRIAKVQVFGTEAEADAHVAQFTGQYPDAFTAPMPDAPDGHWSIDMVTKTITFVPPSPPDFSAIDRAAVDRLLLDSNVMRAVATVQFQIINDVRALQGKNLITSQQYKDKLKGLIR